MNTIKVKFFFLVALCLVIRVSFADTTIPLAGEWRFALDRNDAGTNESWFAKDLPDKIQLPGVLEAQGYGDEISISTPWVLSLYDHFWYLRADYAAYTNAGSVKVPFISQPPRHYLGAAWYQRDIEIPEGGKDERVVLFLERPHWKTTVWLDDKEIGSDISLCTPHEYDLGLVPPGKHRLTIRVDNRMILPYRLDAHSVSDSLDDAWNGIVGKIELRMTPTVWIDEVRVLPGWKKKSIIVKGKIQNITGKSGSGKVGLLVLPPSVSFFTSTNTAKIFNINWSTNGGEFEADLDLGASVEPWDEFHPNIYILDYHLYINSGIESNTVASRLQFGFRDFHAEGNQFILNGHPMYFRGTHFGGDFPLTGYPPTDVASWKKIFETCKSYGLNHMRFHSWCPPEAAFEAADEEGFYLQIECGMWNSFAPGDAMEKQLYSETERIIRDFGNHPSLMLISASNEAHGDWMHVLPAWVKHFRAEDPRHLYTPDTGWGLIDSPDQPLNGGADYLVVGRIGSGRVRGETGWFGSDYGDAIAGINVPVIGHEVGQWCAYPDYGVIKKFTGFMQPGNFEIFQNSAAAHGVLDKDKNFAWASGRFQLECYKEEVEANLRTPGLSGFQLLDLHDYTGQGTALVGLLDPFWETKGYTTPAEFTKFCNTVVPLAWLHKRVFTTDEKLSADIGVANFGVETLSNAVVRWEVHDPNGKTVGECPSNLERNIPIGFKDKCLNFNMGLSDLPAPATYKLVAVVDAGSKHYQNDWNFWLYPAEISDSVPTGVMVTSSWDAAETNLAAGGKVLFLPRNADLDWDSPPLARVPIFWNALMGPTWSRMLGLWCDTNHPGLAEFPTEPNCDWQWTELLRNTRAINLDRLPQALQPMVWAIDDWNRNYKLGLIFEAKVGPGKLVVCPIDLNNNASPVAKQLRRSLLDYMAGSQFQPKTEISLADFESLYFDTRIMHQLGATATADGHRANEIVDGDPNTFWSSADARGRGPGHPHKIEINFPSAVAVEGLIVMPRQNQREHQGDIRDYKIEISDDGASWQEITTGQLASTFDEQKIVFGKTVMAKEIRLTAISGFGTDNAAALAELAVIYAGPKIVDTGATEIEYKNVRTASPDIDAGGGPAKPKRQ
ncbi:MAG TPA: discoidin domain-containing protein [Pseudomonadales bacterium]|nr:discoidin domain-containing protein [Pseudomonadales bacterium]